MPQARGLNGSSSIKQGEREGVRERGGGENDSISKSKSSSTYVFCGGVFCGGGGGGGGGDTDGAPPPLTSDVYGIVHGDAMQLSMSKEALPPSDAVEALLFAGFSETLEVLRVLRVLEVLGILEVLVAPLFLFSCTSLL